MIPGVQDDLQEDFDIITQPTKAYKLDLEKNIIVGYCDGIEALKQAIYKILNTERYDYLIYSWNYGVEIKNLIGEETTLVIPELERVIKEALMQDDRIEDVTDFEFSIDKNVVTSKFKVTSVEGVAEIEKVVSI